MNPRKVKLFGTVLGLTSVVVVFGIFSSRFFSDNFLIASSLIFGISIVNLTMQPGVSNSQASDAGWIGSIGVHAYFAFIAIGVGLAGIILSGFSLDGLSIAADGLSVLSIFLSYALSRMTKEAIERIDSKTNFNSSHLIWSDELALINISVGNQENQEKLLKLIDKSKYLGRDISKEKSAINEKIDKQISNLAASAKDGSSEEVSEILDSIWNDFARRETELKASRRKS